MKQEKTKQRLTRRTLLKTAGVALGAAVVPEVPALVHPLMHPEWVEPLPGITIPQASQAADALKTLTRIEYDTLDAICARIIPADETGPGAREARAARFIDWGLSGTLNAAAAGGRGGRGGPATQGAGARAQYAAGLAAVEAHARASKGSAFSSLSAADQDAIVNDLAQNRVPQAPQGFFNTVRTHTIQGTFSDPFYGGNANFVGWDMIGYPGARIQVDAGLQRIDQKPTPSHKSAYDYAMFSKGEI